jgi:hypothetical protein
MGPGWFGAGDMWFAFGPFAFKRVFLNLFFLYYWNVAG